MRLSGFFVSTAVLASSRFVSSCLTRGWHILRLTLAFLLAMAASTAFAAQLFGITYSSTTGCRTFLGRSRARDFRLGRPQT